MLCDLVAFDSLVSKPDIVCDVLKVPSETSSASSGETLTRAGGVAFNVVDFGDRLFVWHSDNDKLRIRELSFANDILNGSIEFRFSGAKVIHCGIYHERSGLFILVATTDGVYHEHFTCYKQRFKCYQWFRAAPIFGQQLFHRFPTRKFPLPPIQMTYWIWLRLNNYENKIAFDVIRVEPIKQMAYPQVSFDPAVCSLIDFVPFLSHNASNAPDVSMATSLNGATLPTLSVWAVVDVPNENEGSQLSAIPISSSAGYANMQLWQEPLPRSIFVPKHSCNSELGMSGDIVEEEDADLTDFMDFIFTPGRFAKVAIHDAFKSLKQSHHLPQECSPPDGVITILRNEINRVLISILRPSLSLSEFQTLLRTFHQIIVDYHQRASEPLGLFCVDSNGDVVVVRRSGISLVRRLQATEEALLNPSFLNCFRTESDLEVLTSNHQAAKLRARECLISCCRRIVKDLAQCQVWLEHERKICENSENFQNTEVVLNQLLADLPVNWLFGLEEDGSMEGMDDAFGWFLEFFFTPNPAETIVTDLEDEVEEASVDDALVRTHHQRSCLLGFGSSLSAELLRQGVHQATNTSLRFCVAVHLLWRRWNHRFATSLGSSRVEGRLQQIYRRLAVIQWLTTTRAAPPSDRSFLSLAWTHLKLLGMEDLFMDFVPLREFLRSGYHSASNRMHFQFCGLSLFEELILSTPEIFSGFSVGTVRPSWRTDSSTIITALQKLLCPMRKNGENIVPILKHLLLGARCKELLTLCKCLAPNAFDGINAKDLTSVHQDEQIDGRSRLLPGNGSWWSGDANALYVCAFLALLWSGVTDEAVGQYIQGSLCLRRRLLSFLYPFANECSSELTLDENVVVPCFLLEKLFPTEFAPSGSLGFPTHIQDSRGLPSTPLLVDEIQVRYLIKAMPVLEQLDKSEHVIRLCEYALEIIQKASSDACARGLLNFGANPRLTSPLRGSAPISFIDGWVTAKGGKMNHTGLFPTSAVCTDDEKFISLAQNLSELEAVLRTRIFRHELAIGNIARAHALVISNPDKARQRDCLHLLITTLCDRGQTTELVNFEYGCLENELVSTLKSRARAADMLPKSVPRRQGLKEGAVEQEENDFYSVLYAYYVRRSKFHSAVEVCFEQAVRLAEESTLFPQTLLRRAKSDGPWGAGSWTLAALQRQALCLSACINTLGLLPLQDQWVIIRDSEAAFLSDMESCAFASDVSWAFCLEEEGGACENRLGERGSEEMLASEDILHSNNVIRRQARSRILQITDLEHQYIVVRARLRLAQVSWGQGMLRAGSTSLRDLYSALIATALYEEAFQLLVAFDLDPSPLVTTVTSRCVALAEHQQTNKDAFAPSLPAFTNSTAPLNAERVLVIKSTAALSGYLAVAGDGMVEEDRKNDLLDLYWSLLKVLLINLDSRGILMVGDKPRAKWSFDLLACRTILTGSLHHLSSIQLPCWLMRFLSSGPSGPVLPLLRLLLDHNQLGEAYHLAYAILLTIIGSKTGQCPALLREADLRQLQMNLRSSSEHVASSSMYLPHSLLIRLLEALAIVSHKSQTYRLMHTKLQLVMKQYYSILVSVDGKHRQLQS
ncbi:hypothetical protein TcWFU_001843 [Taenia crassiceps]|uniref:Nuclear pore complex protein Nup160 n=1 Tax=Taenia crassiceps TaxID=6207 RepID=A0ABR4QJW4_9CEST